MGPATRVDVLIVGAGIAGLAAAHRLQTVAPSLRVAVVDGAPTAGGLIGSSMVAGVRLDTAADAFLARVDGAVDLAHELGMADDLIAPATGNAGVFVDGQYRSLPGGLVLGVPTDLDAVARSSILSTDGLRRATEDVMVARPYEGGDRSIADAIGSHLGREVVERLVDPLLGGISAANCDDLSIAAAAPQLDAASRAPHLMAALRDQQALATRGQIGVTETRPVFLAPKLGVHTMIARLVDELGDRLVVSTPISSLNRSPDGTWLLGHYQADTVVLATPASVSARLLSALDPAVAQRLAAIRVASVALVLLAYETRHCRIPEGSGVLVPRTEKRFITAASWWNHKWPHLATGDHTFIRASVGRIDDVRFHNLSDTDILAGIHQELAEMVHLDAAPVDAHVARWMHSFPQYDVGHLDRVDDIERSMAASTPGVMLAGATLRGVGLPACIRSGSAAADAAMARLSEGRV
jgi:protoporphyrinogen/coproporphyrinogen III oxidase